MMDISRRKLLRLAPASVAALALGVAALPKIAPARGIPTMAAEVRALQKMTLTVAEQMAHPLLFGGPSGGGMIPWNDVPGVELRIGDIVHIADKPHVVKVV